MALTLSSPQQLELQHSQHGRDHHPDQTHPLYGVASLGGNPAFFPSHSVIFMEDIDSNAIAVTGEAQLQAGSIF